MYYSTKIQGFINMALAASLCTGNYELSLRWYSRTFNESSPECCLWASMTKAVKVGLVFFPPHPRIILLSKHFLLPLFKISLRYNQTQADSHSICPCPYALSLKEHSTRAIFWKLSFLAPLPWSWKNLVQKIREYTK